MVYLSPPASELWGARIRTWCRTRLHHTISHYAHKVENTLSLVSELLLRAHNSDSTEICGLSEA
jgi:hypothetical protein